MILLIIHFCVSTFVESLLGGLVINFWYSEKAKTLMNGKRKKSTGIIQQFICVNNLIKTTFIRTIGSCFWIIFQTGIMPISLFN